MYVFVRFTAVRARVRGVVDAIGRGMVIAKLGPRGERLSVVLLERQVTEKKRAHD